MRSIPGPGPAHQEPAHSRSDIGIRFHLPRADAAVSGKGTDSLARTLGARDAVTTPRTNLVPVWDMDTEYQETGTRSAGSWSAPRPGYIGYE